MEEITTTVMTVTELNIASKNLLEEVFADVRVLGEISNLAVPRSGHWYFSLKDAMSQVRCAMFRFTNMRLNFTPENGMLVEVRGKVSIYPDRGDYQLIVSAMVPQGEGNLRIAYEKLVKKLSEEGLFLEQHKKPLPKFPSRVGVITSATGAALRDILSVLKRRFAALAVVIYPTEVQGAQAAPMIEQAIELAARHNTCDVLIIARGGGSLEDLWGFNDERVARAIYNCHIPIVSGVGHEIDFTITDLVADKRAPTPSAAAELISPDKAELLVKLQHHSDLLKKRMLNLLQYLAQRVDWLQKRLRHPGEIIKQQLKMLANFRQRLTLSMDNYLKQKRNNLQHYARSLQAISPLNTLKRGYSIVYTKADNKIISAANKVKSQDKLTIKLAEGYIDCSVD